MVKPEQPSSQQTQSQISQLKAEVAALTKKLSEQQVAMLQMQQQYCAQITQSQQLHYIQMNQALDQDQKLTAQIAQTQQLHNIQMSQSNEIQNQYLNQIQKLTTEQIQTIQICNDLKAQNQQLLDERSIHEEQNLQHIAEKNKFNELQANQQLFDNKNRFEELKIHHHDILIQKASIEEESVKMQQQFSKIVAEQQQNNQQLQNNIVQLQNCIEQMRNSRQTSLENIHYEVSSYQQQIIQDHQELLRSILSQLRNSAQIQCYNSSQQPAQTYNNEFKEQQQIIYQINDNFVQHSNEQQQQNTTEKQSEQEQEFRSSKDSQNDTQIISANQIDKSKDSTSNADINNGNETQLQSWILQSNNSSYAQDVQKFAELIYGTNILSSGVTCKLCNCFLQRTTNRITNFQNHIVGVHNIDLHWQKYDYEQANTTDDMQKAMDPENYIKDMEKYQLVKSYLVIDERGRNICKICKKCVDRNIKQHISQIHNLIYNKELQKFIENNQQCKSINYFVEKYYLKNQVDNFDVCKLCNQKIHSCGQGLYWHLSSYHQIDLDKQYRDYQSAKSDSKSNIALQSSNYTNNEQFHNLCVKFIKYIDGYSYCNICQTRVKICYLTQHVCVFHQAEYKQIYSSLLQQQNNNLITKFKLVNDAQCIDILQKNMPSSQSKSLE